MQLSALIAGATRGRDFAPIRRLARPLLALMALLALIPLASGCGDRSPTRSDPPTRSPGELKPDFHLQDLNAGSARFGQAVSPRDYLGKVSAWYFGHAG
jgi:hypothetical protein